MTYHSSSDGDGDKNKSSLHGGAHRFERGSSFIRRECVAMWHGKDCEFAKMEKGQNKTTNNRWSDRAIN